MQGKEAYTASLRRFPASFLQRAFWQILAGVPVRRSSVTFQPSPLRVHSLEFLRSSRLGLGNTFFSKPEWHPGRTLNSCHPCKRLLGRVAIQHGRVAQATASPNE